MKRVSFTKGSASPDAEDYSLLADFCYKDGALEIKIPWQLFRVMDPSGKQIMEFLGHAEHRRDGYGRLDSRHGNR